MIEEIMLIVIGDSYDNTLGKFYISTAKDMIKSHLHIDYLEEGLYTNAITMLAIYLYNNSQMLGISSRKEGDITTEVDNIEIPKQIKAMLPKPKVRSL